MIKTITLTDFRNHKTSRINILGKTNVIITGVNGAGKTAILEAISMLGGDRGLRDAPMTDIARLGGTGGFSVHAVLDNETEISVYFNKSDTNRHVKIDGDNSTLAKLAKYLRIAWLTPKEDGLFAESALGRRTFFDRLAASFDSAHAGRTGRLARLLSERAFALKNGKDEHWINALDTQIAGVATAVAAARIQYAGELNYFLKDSAVAVSGILEQIIINSNAAKAERNYLDYLHNNRELCGDKMILDGPHKSDFGVFNKQLKLPASLTSTGQQKMILMNIILAHAKLINTKTGYQPLILLDEVAAHLDKNARKKLFVELEKSNAQVWVTGLDARIFAHVPNAIFVTCTNGKINNILADGTKK